jgi:ABC-type transport system involved in cytochrome c biogenesis permease subunit
VNSTLKKLLKPLASLYLTVPLLFISILLVFAGTWAQRLMGIDDVVQSYFRSWLAWIDPRIFMPGVRVGQASHGMIPFPGGKTLIVLLLANLLAAHSVRFKLNWKRAGILLIHFSLILLLAGELITGYFARESQVSLSNGMASQYTYDIRTPELAIIDPSAADHDQVTVIPGKLLKAGAVIDSPQLPFEVQVDDYFPNSQLLGPVQASKAKVERRATEGEDSNLAVVSQPPNPGTDAEQVDIPGGYVTLRAGNQLLGTYLLSAELTSPQRVEVNGKSYQIALRFKRYYKPYTLTLLHFAHDRYLGTDEAKNFSSRVRLVDAAHHVDREVLIWMNHPLRYAGDTIYQQGFSKDDKFTTLQVVWNPADPLRYVAAAIGARGLPLPSDPLPYVACFLGALGLIIHFGMHLVSFLGRKLSGGLAPPSPATRQASTNASANNWTLPPTSGPFWQRASFLISAVVLLLAVALVGTMATLPLEQHANPYNFQAFGRLPIVSDGRVLPMDSLARNTLRIIHGSDSFKRDKETVPAIQWLLDGFSGSDTWRSDKVVEIDHPDVISMFHLDPKSQFFSIADLTPHLHELQRQAELTQETPSDQQTSTQSKVLQLFESVKLISNVFGNFTNWELYVVPPVTPEEHWRTMNQVVKDVNATHVSPEAAVLFTQIIQDYRKSQPGSFNADVIRYSQYLHQHAPQIIGKTAFEAYLNAFDPFLLCIILYVLVLMLGFTSWLGWQKPLTAAALTLLIFTLLVQSFGLGARIWLQGRPPVTNLYSSSVFIGWGVVLLCILMEFIYRNGIASVTSAVVGFVTLVIALHLQSDARLQPNGDTMAVLRAVLDTNLWLATHVVCITLGYASTFLAGALGVVFVTRGLLTPSLDPKLRKDLSRMIYGIVCFAMFFSFVGTILGGIWADQSWGRFWGWDPKENGAILIVLWNALILHARWSGMVKDRGMALLVIFGNIVTSWSWFGTNMLGIGLHSYGFMDKAVPWLVGFDLSQVALILVGLTPLHRWRSFAPADSGFPVA